MRNGREQIEERKPQKSIGLRHTQRWGLHLGKALDAEQWPQPWAQTMGKGQGAGYSLCDSSPSLSWLQSRGRRSLMETELEIRFRRRGSLRVIKSCRSNGCSSGHWRRGGTVQVDLFGLCGEATERPGKPFTWSNVLQENV